MKTIKVFVYALILCLGFVGVAEAKGRSGSFKSGFSSQKRPAPKPAKTSYQVPPANTQTNKTAFGSFGDNSNQKFNQKAATGSQSQMSKDLSATAAQSNALKTADMRAKANEKINATNSNSDSGWFRSGNQNTQKPNTIADAGTRSQPGHYQPAPQYSGGQQSSGLWHGLIGFMIGNSLAQRHTNTVYMPQENQQIVQNGSQENSTVADGLASQQVQEVPVVEKESFFVKLLRFVAWVALISGVIWVVRKFMNFRHRNLQQAANYSLRS